MQNSHSWKVANHCSKRISNVAKFTFMIYGKKGKYIPVRLIFRTSNSPKKREIGIFILDFFKSVHGGANQGCRKVWKSRRRVLMWGPKIWGRAVRVGPKFGGEEGGITTSLQINLEKRVLQCNSGAEFLIPNWVQKYLSKVYLCGIRLFDNPY